PSQAIASGGPEHRRAPARRRAHQPRTLRKQNGPMSLVSTPLSRTPLSHAETVGPAPSGPTVRAMEVGQHVIAAGLAAIGAVRAIGDGTPIAAAVVSGLAILAWHTAGTILPSRSSSRALVVGWLIGFGVIWIAAV